MVELLSTAFQSGPFGPAISGVDRATGKPAPMSLGNYFLAIDIEALCDLETFKHNAGDLLRFIRGSTKDPRGEGLLLSTCSSNAYIALYSYTYTLLLHSLPF